MNHRVPNWQLADKSKPFSEFFPTSNPKKTLGPEPELMELLWQNGQVVMNSQTHRRLVPSNESKPELKPEYPSKLGASQVNASSLTHEDDTASWLHSPFEDSFGREFYSNFLIDTSNVGAIKEVPPQQPRARPTQSSSKQCENHAMGDRRMLPPKSQGTEPRSRLPNSGSGRVVNFSHFSRLYKSGDEGKGTMVQKQMGETSMMTLGSSNCGSNQVQNEADLSRVSNVFPRQGKVDAQKMASQIDRGETETVEPTVTSSSSGSGGCLATKGNQTGANTSNKRKGRDGDEFECQSEEVGYESVEASKPAPKSAPARRSRAAEVHNLSERRRRDRINEKMRALQELIPHCNKSDKASMLDEAIEYLKSLQLQVQIMWMTSGMAPMIYPNVQHYMSQMSMAMGPASMPSMHSHVHLPRAPVADHSIASVPTPTHMPSPNQAITCPSTIMNPVPFQSQVHNSNLPDSYAQYLRIHQNQMGQAMNLFPYATLQPNQRITPPSDGCGPFGGVVSLENVQSGNLGST